MLNEQEYWDLFKKKNKSKDDDIKITEYNKALIDKYPFLKPEWLFDKKEESTYDYQWTLLDNMPLGWRIRFGIEMCERIKDALISKDEKLLTEYKITDIKEKYGTLRWYSNWTNDAIEKIIQEYEQLSWETCIFCGKPSKYASRGWICPYCSDCANKELKELNVKNKTHHSINDIFDKIKKEV